MFHCTLNVFSTDHITHQEKWAKNWINSSILFVSIDAFTCRYENIALVDGFKTEFGPPQWEAGK